MILQHSWAVSSYFSAVQENATVFTESRFARRTNPPLKQDTQNKIPWTLCFVLSATSRYDNTVQEYFNSLSTILTF